MKKLFLQIIAVTFVATSLFSCTDAQADEVYEQIEVEKSENGAVGGGDPEQDPY